MKTTFETKEDYLKFVQEWKTIYKELSSVIRTLKFGRKALASSATGRDRFGIGEGVEVTLACEVARAKFKSLKLRVPGGESYWDPSALATLLLEIRKAGKVASHEAYLRSKQVPA
jgi:hypothetical protein